MRIFQPDRVQQTDEKIVFSFVELSSRDLFGEAKPPGF